MNDAELFTNWYIALGIATVVVLIAASLLIGVWLATRRILKLAIAALGLVTQIKENTQSIWNLKDTNSTAVKILTTATAIKNHGALVRIFAAVLLFLQGVGPLPEFDELGRPAWLFDETVHRGCTRAGYYEEGTFAEEYGDKECLVEIGCWGPVVECNINKRGAINHLGGCMNVGAPCIGCTMPSFPDGFSPFYARPPGTLISSTMAKANGFIIRKLRDQTKFFQNRSRRWEADGHVPSGWGHTREPMVIDKISHYFYQKLQFMGGKRPGSKN